MRIIAGDYKGRKLETPYNDNIRPTSEKVKEAIFSILTNDLEDAVCIDLFAGTGNLGLEALSRGAEFCLFCDKERDSISIIKENIARCKAEEYSKVIHGDYKKALKSLEGKADIIFMDPPYAMGLYEKALLSIDSLDLLQDDGIIVVEHQRDCQLPEQVGSLNKYKDRTYGRTIISLYKNVR